jgi:hypothetical protein
VRDVARGDLTSRSLFEQVGVDQTSRGISLGARGIGERSKTRNKG